MSSFNYWLLVDTVRIPDAYTIINKEILIKESVPLFQGCNFEYLLDQSPLLINLGQDKSILDKWKSLPYFDSSSVMFAVNETVDTSTLLSHLHKLLIIQVDGKKNVISLLYQCPLESNRKQGSHATRYRNIIRSCSSMVLDK